MKELLDKVLNVIDNHVTYHNWYGYGEIEEHATFISFDVYGYSDQGEGYEWTEHWAINNEGKIYTEDITYNSYEEFLREWV